MPHNDPITITTPEGTPERTDAARQRCIDQGGTWDATTRTCTLPERKPVGAGGSIETEAQQRAVGRVTDTERQNLEFEAFPKRSAAKQLEIKEQETERLAVIETEKQRLLTEESPELRQLDPSTSALEAVPVLGGTFGAIKDTLQEIVLSTVPEGEFKEQFKENLGVATPEELRTMALNQIEKNEIERGLTASEKFGRLLEGTGLSRFSLFGLSVSDLVETPSENAQQVFNNMVKLKRTISAIESNVKLGDLPIAEAQSQIDDIESKIQGLESRLKMLINNSPELKFNSDLVNTWEEEIFTIRKKLFQAKLNVLSGKILDDSARTDFEISLKLEEQRQSEDNDDTF